MDPITAVGFVASVGQLIDAAAGLVRYINDVKNAPKDRARLALECANLVAFLTQFRYAIEDLDLKHPQLTGIRLLAGEDGPLEQLTEAIKTLFDKLKPAGLAGKVVKAVTWPFEKPDVDDILSRIERLKLLISLHREGDHFRISLQIHDDVVELKGQVERGQKDREHQEILNWISDLDFSKKQADYLARCQRGTGEWFLKGDAFKAWLDGPPRTLWCHGQPGAGKTILTSLIINHLEHRFGSHTGLAYVYFNYKEHGTQTADSLITSLLKQLVRANGHISHDIMSTYNRYSKKGSRPTSDEWSGLLHAEVRRLSDVFIVVDALDECSNDARDDFLGEIQRLQSTVHILITSRLISSIETELSKGLQTEIKASDSDVKQYLETRIRNESRLACLLRGDAELQATIVESIVKNAKGMFLLAQLQMDSVAKKNNRRGIRRSLASLPQKLNDTYEQAMRRIWSQSQEDIDLAEQLLSWIVCAKRPLKLIEVQHALAVEEGDVDLDEEGIPDEDLMISACAGLVTADRESTVIRLVHHTAQEYFEQIFATRFPRAQINITSTCLTYLSFDALDAKGGWANELKDLLEHYPLAEYAVQFWGEHARGGPELSLEESITTFLKNGSKAAVWYRISRYLRHGYDNPSSHATGLHIASGFGLSRIVRSLISASNIDVNTRDSSGLTPLHWAARDGQEAGVKELLKYPNVIADASSYRRLTPLFLAAANGHAGVVSLLLQRQDIDVDVKDSNFGQSPLWKAVDGGHVAVVQLLLGHPNVTVNSRNRPWGQTPLWRAAEHGHTAIVRLLLQRPEVDANAADSNYAQTPLQRATENGHTAVVELLRRHSGIDVVSTDRPFTTSSTLSIDGAVHISYSLVTAL